jgi:predicted dehydrogenase
MLNNTKVLIIGYGSIAKKHIKILKFLLPNLDIAILRVKSKKKAGNYKTFWSLKDAINFKPKIIYICSGSNKHIFYFKKFKNITKNIFIEKPLSNDLGDVKNLIIPSKNNFQVGYFLRFHPLINQIQKIIIKKNFGNVKLAKIHVGQHLSQWRKINYEKSVTAKKKLGGGALLELSHEIDYAVNLFGYPKYVYCVKKKLSNLKIQTEDSVNIIFEYAKDDKIIEISLNMFEKFKSRSLKIIFENSTLELDLLKNSLFKKQKKVKLIKDLGTKYTKKLFFLQTNLFLKKSINNYKNKFKEKTIDNNFSSISSSVKLMKIIHYLNLSNKMNKKIQVRY